jgi:hypothetical protein
VEGKFGEEKWGRKNTIIYEKNKNITCFSIDKYIYPV